MDYHLHCIDCNEDSEEVEYSLVSHYSIKTIPYDYETLVEHWTPFLVKHSGHKIELLDSKGKRTDPVKVTAGYVLGLKEYEEKKEILNG